MSAKGAGLGVLVLCLFAGWRYYEVERARQSAEPVDVAKEVAASSQKANEPYAHPGEDLVRAYDANEVGAGRLYGDKVIRVRGRVEEIKDGSFGGAYVLLATGVRCDFSEAERAALATLRKGQEVTVEGCCRGRKWGSVVLTECALK